MQLEKRSVCPECGSPNIAYDERFQGWRCQTCTCGFQHADIVYYEREQEQIRTKVILKQGEFVLKEAKAKETLYYQTRGFLTLTNSRLVFEKVYGMFGNKKEILWSTPLSDIQKVDLEGLFSKSLVIEISWLTEEHVRGISKYKFSISEARDWESAIREAVHWYCD